MDDVSWRALYMNEPIEREGLVYSEDELRRYFELPKEDPDAVIGICDTKDKGLTMLSCRWPMCMGMTTILTIAFVITVCPIL